MDLSLNDLSVEIAFGELARFGWMWSNSWLMFLRNIARGISIEGPRGWDATGWIRIGARTPSRPDLAILHYEGLVRHHFRRFSYMMWVPLAPYDSRIAPEWCAALFTGVFLTRTGTHF